MPGAQCTCIGFRMSQGLEFNTALPCLQVVLRDAQYCSSGTGRGQTCEYCVTYKQQRQGVAFQDHGKEVIFLQLYALLGYTSHIVDPNF